MWRFAYSLRVTESWSYSPAIAGELFRFSHFCPTGYGRGLIAQASLNYPRDLYQPQPLYYRQEREIILLERPAPLDGRAIGVRAFYPVDQWLVFIEVWDSPMPLFPDSSSQSSSTGTTTTVTASTTSISLLAANTSRKGVAIYNNSTVGTLYISYGATASLTAFAEKIGPSTLWEMPNQYTGAISGIWSATGGNALVTEFT